MLEGLLEALRETGIGTPTAGEIMSRPVRFVDADTSVTDALVTAQRYGHSGICVREADRVVGVVARRDLDKAIRHGLGQRPREGRHDPQHHLRAPATGVDELRRIMVSSNMGACRWSPKRAYQEATSRGSAPVEAVVGIVTRTDVLAAYQGQWEKEQAPAESPQVFALEALSAAPVLRALSSRPARPCLTTSPESIWWAASCATYCWSSPTSTSIIAVEGDGIGFATASGCSTGGRVRAHRKFKTAVVLLPPEVLGQPPAELRKASEPFHVDVATTRTEFYEHPAALPRVEHASIRQDLFRRDFTVNAMAISLSRSGLWHCGGLLRWISRSAKTAWCGCFTTSAS